MEIIYYSITGNVEHFISKTKAKNHAINMKDALEDKERGFKLDNIKPQSSPFILVISTIKFGEIPEEVTTFLTSHDNYQLLRGVISSGNKNWGPNYGRAADLISQQYHVPVIMKFELRGTNTDVNTFNELIPKESYINEQ